MLVVKEQKSCVTIIDRFFRFPMAITLRNIEATRDTAALLKHWVYLFGSPNSIRTDKGSQFENILLAALAEAVNARRIRISSRHSVSNGMALFFKVVMNVHYANSIV